ncbi:hypothetical protein MA9V1_107 [Chryseobacterium phage MA9V-1]|nr:hypothetical protein MA9V1_107 [Chryseobacterium phage MA9V-1]
MKLIKSNNALHVQIESHEELCYIEVLLQVIFRDIYKICIESGEPPYRYNHLLGMLKGPAKATFSLACMSAGVAKMSEYTAQKFTTDPLLSMQKSMDSYMSTLTKTFIRNGEACISLDSGGIQFNLENAEVMEELNAFPDYTLQIDKFRKSTYFWTV